MPSHLTYRPNTANTISVKRTRPTVTAAAPTIRPKFRSQSAGGSALIAASRFFATGDRLSSGGISRYA